MQHLWQKIKTIVVGELLFRFLFRRCPACHDRAVPLGNAFVVPSLFRWRFMCSNCGREVRPSRFRQVLLEVIWYPWLLLCIAISVGYESVWPFVLAFPIGFVGNTIIIGSKLILADEKMPPT